MKNHKGKNNPKWKGDKAIYRQKHYCADCLKIGIKTKINYRSKKIRSYETKRKFKQNIFNNNEKNKQIRTKSVGIST